MVIYSEEISYMVRKPRFPEANPPGAVGTAPADPPASDISAPSVEEGTRLINAFRRIRDPKQRRAILKFFEDLAGKDQD